MAWTNPTTQSTGTLITATIWNTDIVDNLTALRSGSVALTSQATGDVIYASSSTQLGRVAIGTSGYVLTSNGSAPAWSNTPTLTGTNFTGIPAASILAGTFGSGNYTIPGLLTVSGVNSAGTTTALVTLAGTNTTQYTGLQVANAWLWARTSTTETILSSNNNGWTHTITGATAAYSMSAGVHTWRSGASQSAGSAVNETTLMQLSSAGLLTVSGFGTHSFSAGGTGANRIDIRNTTAGASNLGMLRIGNDAQINLLEVMAFSSTYTTANYAVANGVALNAGGVGGMSIVAENASGDLRFYNRGATLALTLGASQAASFTGDLSLAATKKLYLDGGGDTYMYEATANGIDFIVGGATQGQLRAGSVYFQGAYDVTTASAANLFVASNGSLQRSTSSLRYKHDIDTLDADHALSAVMAMRPVTYRGKTDEDQRRYVGFIAEEMQTIAPLLATYDEGGESGTPNYVTYDRVTAYLVAVVQKQQAEINALKAQMKEKQ